MTAIEVEGGREGGSGGVMDGVMVELDNSWCSRELQQDSRLLVLDGVTLSGGQLKTEGVSRDGVRIALLCCRAIQYRNSDSIATLQRPDSFHIVIPLL